MTPLITILFILIVFLIMWNAGLTSAIKEIRSELNLDALKTETMPGQVCELKKNNDRFRDNFIYLLEYLKIELKCTPYLPQRWFFQKKKVGK